MLSPRYLTLPFVLAGILWLGGASAQAQSVRRVGPERVTVKAEGVALGDLLDQLAVISPLERLTIDPVDRLVSVSLVAEDVYALEAMGLALKASGLDFVMSSRRILAGRAKKALEEAATLAGRREPEDKRETAQEAPMPVSGQPVFDEHDLVQPVVPVPPPAPSSVVERPGELVTSSSDPMPGEPTLFDKKRRPMSQAFAKPTPDEFGREGGAKVAFTIHEDSVTITQQGFVPYKLRPEVVSRRLAAKLGDIP